MKEQVLSKLTLLVGSKLHHAGRAADIVWMQFGEIDTIFKNGQTRNVAEFSLNVQCAWRLTDGAKILVASKDKFVPGNLYQGTIQDFDWDVQGMNRLDEMVQKHINNSNNTLIVKAVEADSFGGVKITFSNDYCLEIFPDESTGEEYWRLIFSKEKKHFIVTANGTEIV